MDIHQLKDIPSQNDFISQILIGLKEGSAFESERQDCKLEKGEE